MRPLHIDNSAFRAALALLAVAVLAFAGMTFFRYATLPTDENTFISSPSLVEIGTPFPGVPQETKRYRGKMWPGQAENVGDSLRPRDLLLAIGRSQVRTMESFRRVVEGLAEDTVTINVLRPSAFLTTRWSVRKADLKREWFIEQKPSVMVIGVEPGGASDRAGMREGDFILRINGVGFTSDAEADRIMRQGMSGEANTYDIMRDGVPLRLDVVLARFGFSLGNLMLLLSGVVFIGVGLFVGLKRPGILPARLLAIWMVCLGYVIAAWTIRRDPAQSAFVVARDALLFYAAFFGAAVSFHSALAFPWQRSMGVWRRRGLTAMYALAVVGPLTALAGLNAVGVVLFLIVLVIGVLVKQPFGGEGTPQQRALERPIKSVTILTIAGAIGASVFFGVLGLANVVGIVGIFLAFIPLSYLYTIGHYRLLEFDFRVRRNVQYSLFSWLWGGVVLYLLVWLFHALPAISLPLPNIALSGFSIEVRQEPLSAEGQLIAQRTVSMVLGVGVALVLWRLRGIGQRLIDRKYYRTQFDYKRAAEQMADILATKLSMTDLARGVVEALMELLKIRSAGLVVFRNDRTCCCDAASGVPADQWQALSCSLDTRFAGTLAVANGTVPVDKLPEDLRDALKRMNFEHVIPIRSKGELSGAIIAGQKLSDMPHTAEDLSFLTGVAQQVSVSIENAFLYEGLAEQERMRHELSIARQIQMDSLPAATPSVAGLDVAGGSTPALEVGGDFFDYLDGSGRDLLVVVGDVSGKGTSAALYVSKVQGILRSLHEFGLAPRDLFLRVNRLLCADLQKNSFITAAAALFTPHERKVTLVRAGHLPLFFYRISSRAVQRLVPRGLGLGLSDAGIFSRELEERTEPYQPGDVLLLVTDGVTEARDPHGREYGEERLAELLAGTAHLSAEEIRTRLIADLATFGGGEDPHDDQTIVVIRIP